MDNSKRKKTKRKFDKRFWIFLFLAIVYIGYLCLCNYYENQPQEEVPQIIIEETESLSDEMIDGVLHVHMIDCGQGDCFLFEYEGLYGMIDCGTQDSKDKVIEYLDNQKVTKLEFIVGTHQHEDHMGGASAVIDKYEVETIYEPNIGDYAINTKWYKKYNYIVENKKIPVKKPKVGDKFYLGETVFEVIGQLNIDEAGNNLNNVSTVIKVTLGQMDILMTGDAETAVEKAILSSNPNLNCEILKLGHHGSDTSTSKKFLNTVNPDYALISCGVGNKYKHPKEETMDKLKEAGVKVYRTDEVGTVVLTVTGTDVTFDRKNGDYLDGVTIGKKRGFTYD